MDIVLKLRELRHHRGLSQKDVARVAGVGEKTLSSFETGERIDTMKIAQLRVLLTLYGVTEEEFFSDKLDEMFDPTYVKESTRIDTIMERVSDLPEQVRIGILERVELMLDTAELTLDSRSARAPTRMRPPTAASSHRPAA